VLQVDGGGAGAGVIGADDLDRTAIAGAVLLNDHDAVVGLLAGANARQTNHYHGDTVPFKSSALLRSWGLFSGQRRSAFAQGQIKRPGMCARPHKTQHLSIAEIGFRLRQTLAEDAPVIQPFDQDRWAATYAGISADKALEVFAALREWNLRLIVGAMPRAADRKVTHPERGAMTFKTIVETMAGHDLNHLGQLRKMAGVDQG
jgi:hypothetical protein